MGLVQAVVKRRMTGCSVGCRCVHPAGQAHRQQCMCNSCLGCGDTRRPERVGSACSWESIPTTGKEAPDERRCLDCDVSERNRGMTKVLCSLSRGKKQSTRRRRKSITRGIELGENGRWGSGRRALVRAQAHFGREALAAMLRPFHRWPLLLPYVLTRDDLAIEPR